MYTPPQDILEKYADVLVNFALGDGQGIEAGDVVYVACPEAGKSLYLELQKAVLRAGGHVIPGYSPSPTETESYGRNFYDLASDAQLSHFPKSYYEGLTEAMDHMLMIEAETDPQKLKGVEGKKIMTRQKALHPFREMRSKKEERGEFSWTIALFGTEAQAAEANLSLEEYWQEIIHACYLDESDPTTVWQKTYEDMDEIIAGLNNLDIESVHVEAENIDLEVKIGKKRRWHGGGGSNIPSYEIFTSPDWRGTEGTIRFNQPLYRYGNLVKGISLTFEDGEVVEAAAEENEQILKDMIATDEGAKRVGEFSLTDHRFSRIGKFMAHTLYDENVGADNGNTHIALGRSLKAYNYAGDASSMSEDDWVELGFNTSAIHTDIISTEPRVATATLTDGSEQVIYKDGEFQV